MRLFGVNLGQKIENHLVQKSLEHAKRFYFSESLSLTARFCENLRPMPLFVLSAYAGSILSFLRSFLPIMYQLGQKKNKLKIVFVFQSFKIKKNEFKIKNFVFFYHSTSLKIVNMLFVKILQQLFFRILQPVTWLFYYSKTYSCNNFHL